MRRVVSLIPLCLLPICVAQEHGDCFSHQDQHAAQLKALAEQTYIEGVPVKQAHEFSSNQDVNMLVCLLRSKDESAHSSSIAVLLGLGKNTSATAPLIDFIEHGEAEQQLSWPQFAAKTSALVALGYLASTDRNALQYLENHSNPVSWKDARLTWSGPGRLTIADRNEELSKSAVQGLGVSGNAEAASWLAKLQSSPQGTESEWKDLISEALTANKFIRQYGLEAYSSSHGQ